MHSSGGKIEQGVAGPLHTALNGLLEHPLTALSDSEVVAAMQQVERCARILSAVQHRFLVEASERKLPARFGAKSLKNFLMQTLRLASADAGARVNQSIWVATFHDMAGEPVTPRLPHTAQALTAGDISADHARGIATVMNRIPHGASSDERAAAEEILTEFARDGSPDDIGKIGDRILAHLDPDGRLTTDNDRARMRGIIIGRQRPDGMSPIRGEVDPVLRALLDPLLAKYARPGMCNPDDPASPTIDGTYPVGVSVTPKGAGAGPVDASGSAVSGPASPIGDSAGPTATAAGPVGDDTSGTSTPTVRAAGTASTTAKTMRPGIDLDSLPGVFPDSVVDHAMPAAEPISDPEPIGQTTEADAAIRLHQTAAKPISDNTAQASTHTDPAAGAAHTTAETIGPAIDPDNFDGVSTNSLVGQANPPVEPVSGTTLTEHALLAGAAIHDHRTAARSAGSGGSPAGRSDAATDTLIGHASRPAWRAPDNTSAEHELLAEAAARDHRTPAQRNHDALKAILQSGVIAERLGAHRGVPVATILTMSIDDVERGAGVATTATGGTVPMRDALALAERSQPWLAVFDHAGLPLHLGRMKRLASREQRLALIAALKGCSRPGCDAPASLCAVHHIRDYRRNGTTDIENLTLACDSCHALIHDGPGGWATVVQGPDTSYPGRTAWIAPSHIDPRRVPRVNHRHHARELLAEVLTRIDRRNERDRERHHRWRRMRSADAHSRVDTTSTRHHAAT
nr:DUF222 domain-containing protein [Nocardia cyriacigeorgica]